MTTDEQRKRRTISNVLSAYEELSGRTLMKNFHFHRQGRDRKQLDLNISDRQTTARTKEFRKTYRNPPIRRPNRCEPCVFHRG